MARPAGWLPARDVCAFVREYYSVDAAEALPMARASHEVWHVRGIVGEFVFKRFAAADRVAAVREVRLVAHLHSHGFRTGAFVSANDGSFVTKCHGAPAHLRTFVHGVTVGQNEAPPWLLEQSATLLAQLCRAMAGVQGLPEGFPAHWYAFDLNRKMIEYDALIIAASRSRRHPALVRRALADDFAFRRAALGELGRLDLAPGLFSSGPSHGDFSIRQLICRNKQISAVIDFSSACRQPYVWEILRSYSYADPAAADGVLDIAALTRYVAAFVEVMPLAGSDLAHAADLYYAQLLRSTYGYRQVLLEGETSPELLDFARWRTSLCRWLQEHRFEVAEALRVLTPSQRRQRSQ